MSGLIKIGVKEETGIRMCNEPHDKLNIYKGEPIRNLEGGEREKLKLLRILTTMKNNENALLLTKAVDILNGTKMFEVDNEVREERCQRSDRRTRGDN
eukprot:scaffold3309_cov76-Cylindrotheca_fusiformis.AAC.2